MVLPRREQYRQEVTSVPVFVTLYEVLLSLVLLLSSISCASVFFQTRE